MSYERDEAKDGPPEKNGDDEYYRGRDRRKSSRSFSPRRRSRSRSRSPRGGSRDYRRSRSRSPRGGGRDYRPPRDYGYPPPPPHDDYRYPPRDYHHHPPPDPYYRGPPPPRDYPPPPHHRGGPPPPRPGGYRPRGRDEGAPGVSLLVRNVSPDITTADLQNAFGRIGEVRDVYIPRDYHSQQPKGFAFVEFANASEAREAREEMDRFVIKGRELEVVFAQERRKTPDEMRTRVVNTQNRGPPPPQDRGGGDRHRRSSSFERHRQRERDRSPPRGEKRDRSPPPRDGRD